VVALYALGLVATHDGEPDPERNGAMALSGAALGAAHLPPTVREPDKLGIVAVSPGF
jgi:hypothetical protein